MTAVNLVRIRRSRLILCCLAIHAARYSLSAVFSTSPFSLWISCFSDAVYSRSCFRWWARVWMSGFTIFSRSHRRTHRSLVRGTMERRGTFLKDMLTVWFVSTPSQTSRNQDRVSCHRQEQFTTPLLCVSLLKPNLKNACISNINWQ